MTPSDYAVIFDVREQSFFATQSVVGIVLGAVLALGIAWWTDQKGARILAVLVSVAFLVFGVFWAWSSWQTHAKYQTMMIEGEFSEIEGPVEQFRSDADSRGGTPVICCARASVFLLSRG